MKVAVDAVIFTLEDRRLKVLLIRRRFKPFRGRCALPGGFIRPNEDLYKAAQRELQEETGVKNIFLEQLYTFGSPRRDPRGRVISAVYFALAPRHLIKFKVSDDAQEAGLFEVKFLPKLAFDHRQIIKYALTRLRNKIDYTNAVWSLLKPKFTLREIQEVYETIWSRKVDKRNFRKKILSLGLIKETSGLRRGFRQRPAKLYVFKTKEYTELKRFFN